MEEHAQAPPFRRRVVIIAPAETLPFVAADWADTLVTITRGEVDLCGALGTRRRFAAGAILVLAGLGLRALHNPGPEDVVLVAVSRALGSISREGEPADP